VAAHEGARTRRRLNKQKVEVSRADSPFRPGDNLQDCARLGQDGMVTLGLFARAISWSVWLCSLVLVLSAKSAAAQDAPYYYFDPDGRGAHAFYNPQNFIVQGGLGALYQERVDTFDWLGGFETVNHSLTHPVKAVRDYGWERFFYREFIPHLGPGQNYVPNYVWHFLGGGMRTKLMEEYFTYHRFPLPRLWAWTTMYAYHYLNEAVQAERFAHDKKYTVDPLPDMMFFDWLGGLVFRFDRVNRYMSRRLHMREWSYQAQFNPFTLRLLNNGQLYWLRRHLAGPISLSFLTGEQISSLNLTVGWGAGHQISAGAGPKSKAFVARKNGDTDPAGIVFSYGLYYSVNDNPFVVLTYEPKGARSGKKGVDSLEAAGKCMLNVYPGPLEIAGQPFGLSMIYQRGTVFLGLTFGYSPLGLTAGMPHSNEVLTGAGGVVTRAERGVH
jgi:hypothetical protein